MSWEIPRGGRGGVGISCPQARNTISTNHTSIIHAVGSEQRAHTTDCHVVSGRKEPRRARFRVEAIGKFAAGQGANSKKGLYFIVKSFLMQALHAVAGAGAAYPGTY